MRHLFVYLVVAAATALLPTWALAGNQEAAEQIAAKLRESGQLHGYKIGVKYQNGTAWLRGRVSGHEQMNTALKLVFQTAGVTRVVNNLTVDPASTVAFSGSVQPTARIVTPTSANQSLQQIAGAVAPEQLPRSVSSDLRIARSRRVETNSHNAKRLQQAAADVARDFAERRRAVQAPMPQMAGPVNRVATTVYSSPVQPVNALALSEPTRAPLLAPMVASQTSGIVEGLPEITVPQVAAAQAPVPQMAAPAAVVLQAVVPQAVIPRMSQPIPIAYIRGGGPMPIGQPGSGPVPQYVTPVGMGAAPARYDQPHLPNYAWPSYAAYPNYAALTYPKQYSPTAWPYIGPFYPYPQVPLGWRKVTLEWHDGWWQLDFDDGSTKGLFSGLFRPYR